MNTNDQNHSAPQKENASRRKLKHEEAAASAAAAPDSEEAAALIRRNHEALMRFFADAEKEGAKTAANTEEPPLFVPELSEPLTVDEIVPMAAELDAQVPKETDLPQSRSDTPSSDVPESAAAAPQTDETPTEAPLTFPDLPPKERHARRPARILLTAVLSLLCVVCLLFGIGTGILFYESRPQTVDLDARPSLGLLETNALFSGLVKMEITPDAIDTSTISDQQIPLVFWGFLPHTAHISVRDLTPPAVTVCRLHVPLGFDPEPAQCVLAYEDKTAVTFSFESRIDTAVPGTKEASLLAEDVGGNVTATPVTVLVMTEEDSAPIYAEFGISLDGITALLTECGAALTDFDLSAVDVTAIGDYFIPAASKEDAAVRRITHLSLADTTPPEGRAHSFTYAAKNLTSENALVPEDFVTEITDASPVTLAFVKAPNYTRYQTQEIVVSATDAHGNRTDFDCQLQLLDIPAEITVECGTPTDDFLDTLLRNVSDDDRPTVTKPLDTSSIIPGIHTLTLRGKYSTLSVRVTAEDTTPPVLVTRPVTAYIGNLPAPDAFVADVKDATDVTFSYLTAPDVSREGTVKVTIVATDAAGNTAKEPAEMQVIVDTVPPVIRGVRNIYAQENATVSFRKGVTATDAADGTVAVKVDASAVDMTKSGTYQIIYTASDKAGNVATQYAYVYVTGANQTTINMYADQILSSILTNGMTERQKASAIYSWCVGHLRYSTSTSHLMGQYLKAAYSGFATHAGNCYTYYAVASALLTRAGIENLEIQRSKPNNPHYWNLVKIDGDWYHLDTCPKMKKYPIKTFLLTDAQVIEYSRTQAKDYYTFDASLYPATP